MIGFILILAASTVGVQSQRRAVATIQTSRPAPLNQFVIQAEPYFRPPIVPSCERIFTVTQAGVPNIATTASALSLPAAVVPITAAPLAAASLAAAPVVAPPVVAAPVASMPVLPFVTDLPSCPDLYFNEILVSPVGCLDPILGIYGAVAISEMPMSPLLPAASPVSALAPPFSSLLPPATVCDCDSTFLKRVPIPPPFI